MKCLVVDDSAVTRRILVNSLRAVGFTEIVEAEDGRQALQRCDESIDVVITDWNMPAMGGLELVRSLRAKPGLATLPVLLITARHTYEDVVEAAGAGVDDYLIKPFTPAALQAKLERLLHPQAPGEATGTEG
jgi:two-component system chemotaxis response regulator CheY